MNLDTQALEGIVGILKALFLMMCTCDPADTEEEQLDRASAGACIVTQCSRPDPVKMATWWNAIIQKSKASTSVWRRWEDSQAQRGQGRRLRYPRSRSCDCVKVCPRQSNEYIKILEILAETAKPRVRGPSQHVSESGSLS